MSKFGITLLNEITCQDCKTTSYVFEDHFNLSLGYPKPQAKGSSQVSYTLGGCLDWLTRVEEVQNYYCKSCCAMTTTHRKTSIWKLREVLVLHFKKFKMNSMSSNDKDIIKFPLDDLVMDKYIYEASGREKS